MSIFVIILSLSIPASLLYTILIWYFTYGWFSIKNNDDENFDPTISVSVIVPFRNEENNLATLMQCLSKQYYPAQLLEVILVNDHSEDKSLQLVNDFIAVNELSNFSVLSLEDGEGISKKAALSKGIQHSHGEIIITTDADCTMGEFWVSAMIEKHLSGNFQMISGPVCITPRQGLFSRMQSLEFFSLIGCGAGAIAMGKPFLANGANLAFSRRLYSEVQGYSKHIGYASGDDVFMLLQAKKKHRIAFHKDKAAIVYTRGANTLKAFFHQRIRWASKSSGYKDTSALTTALSVFLLNVMILFSCGLGFFDHRIFFFSGGVFLLKMLVDLPLFLGVSGFFNLRRLMWYYIPMQLLYTIYILVTAFLSWLITFEWKDRKMRK